MSRRLRRFEEDAGGALFDRTPDGLLTTELAKRLLPHAEQAEAAVLEATAEAAGLDVRPEGRVRVALADAFAVYVVAPRLATFLADHPGLSLDLLASTELVDMSRREADIAVRFVRPTRGDLVAKRVGIAGAYQGFVTRSYAAHRDDLSVAGVDWISWTADKSHLPEARLFERAVGREPRVGCDNLVVMIEAARAGAGAMLLPSNMSQLYEDVVALEHPEPAAADMEVWLVTHRALRDVPRIRVVWDWLESLVLELAT